MPISAQKIPGYSTDFRCKRVIMLVKLKERISMSYGSRTSSWKLRKWMRPGMRFTMRDKYINPNQITITKFSSSSRRTRPKDKHTLDNFSKESPPNLYMGLNFVPTATHFPNCSHCCLWKYNFNFYFSKSFYHNKLSNFSTTLRWKVSVKLVICVVQVSGCPIHV